MDPNEGKPADVGVPHAVIEDFHGQTLNDKEKTDMLNLSC